MIDTIHHRKLIADGALLLELGTTTRPIVVYCRSGGRSAQATAVLRQAGYQVKDLGPMTAW